MKIRWIEKKPRVDWAIEHRNQWFHIAFNLAGTPLHCLLFRWFNNYITIGFTL